MALPEGEVGGQPVQPETSGTETTEKKHNCEPLAWYQDKRFLLFAIILIGGIWLVVNVIAPLFQ
jgi:hypothetical protein